MVYNAKDYGVKPGTYCEKELQKFLESIPNDSEEKVIEFPRGTYLIDTANLKERMLYITNTAGDNEYKKDETPHKSCTPFYFENLKNVTVEGNGSGFIIHGKATNMVISNCENIKIQNLSIDVENPEMHELKVVNKKLFYVDFKVDNQSKYENVDGKLSFVGKDYVRPFTDCAKSSWWNAHIKADNQNYIERGIHPLATTFKLRDLGKNVVRAYMLFTKKFIKGDRYYLFDNRRQYAGIFVHDSKNVTIEKINQHFNYSLAFVAQNTENITIDSVKFAPRKMTGRLMCSVADFIQICMCKGQVTIKDSYFDGAGDDLLNVHGFHFKIKEKNGNKIVVSFMHPQSHGFNPLNIGDEIAFIDVDSMLQNGTSKILESKMLNENDIELTLTDSKDAVLGQVIENISSCPNVTFINNSSTRIITRGLLLTTRGKVLIENNDFKSTSMSGILMSDDAKTWYESGMCLDMTIRNNNFDYCGENGVLILPENNVHKGAVHKNITIENNTFKKCMKPCFYIKSASDIVIKNNKIGETPKKIETKNVENLQKDFE